MKKIKINKKKVGKLYTHTTEKKKPRSFLERMSEFLFVIYFLLFTIPYIYISITSPIDLLYDAKATPGTNTTMVCNDSILTDELFNMTIDNQNCQVLQLGDKPGVAYTVPWYYEILQAQWAVVALGVLHIIYFKRTILKRKITKVIEWLSKQRN